MISQENSDNIKRSLWLTREQPVVSTVVVDCCCQDKWRRYTSSEARGEKSSTATKTIRSDNESAYGSKESAERVIGRKVDVLVEHDQFELSASEWKTFGSGRGLLDKQHNKNVRVNACILLQHLRLPYTETHNEGHVCVDDGVE
ncbi:predicted protein [Lichtheimia corymbifera JMRC:FSU:9682]|uniref:Uncharacterized protein n=1 Tax=Lichtheimia corymbifera JMRC:FSU:9682 TaxID=1263082 RepID=A0A068RXG4_9FUNG|nr:predicted protein [Lichtheimia corymbifera JMRC:FSU:9682]